jgi:hypothetical protein
MAFPSVSTQNKAHREDMLWVKAGADYMRSDGYTLRKHPRTGYWYLFDADGVEVRNQYNFRVGGHTLTWAKVWVEQEGY